MVDGTGACVWFRRRRTEGKSGIAEEEEEWAQKRMRMFFASRFGGDCENEATG